jgi:hypothetical protein
LLFALGQAWVLVQALSELQWVLVQALLEPQWVLVQALWALR